MRDPMLLTSHAPAKWSMIGSETRHDTYDHRYERCRRPVCDISCACDRGRPWRRRWFPWRWLRIQRRVRIPWWVWLRISRWIRLLLRRLWLVGTRRGARPWAGGDRRRPGPLSSSAGLLCTSASVLSAATTDLQSGAGRRRSVLLRRPICVPDGSSGRDRFRLLLPGQQRSESGWSGQLINGSFLSPWPQFPRPSAARTNCFGGQQSPCATIASQIIPPHAMTGLIAYRSL